MKLLSSTEGPKIGDSPRDPPLLTIKPLVDLDPVIDRAAAVLGDRQEAMRWLGMPVRGLDFATPISLLGTEEGQARGYDILGQMEHGIW